MNESIHNTEISIARYDNRYEKDLLRMLLMLQDTYFNDTASAEIKELMEEVDIESAYQDYLEELCRDEGGTSKIFLAMAADKPVGFITGSIEKDETLVKGTIGKIEDWYVADEYRGTGAGMRLYGALEQWFLEKDCEQVRSETWKGYELSINAHKRAGFFISGISFSKKLK